MATKVLKFGKHTMKHRAASLAGRFAVADVLAFGSEKYTFEKLIEELNKIDRSGRVLIDDDAVVCEEYEYYDSESLIRKLYELKAGYITYADALLVVKED